MTATKLQEFVQSFGPAWIVMIADVDEPSIGVVSTWTLVSAPGARGELDPNSAETGTLIAYVIVLLEEGSSNVLPE